MTRAGRPLGYKRVSIAIVEPDPERRREISDALTSHGFDVLANATNCQDILAAIVASGRSPMALLLSSRVLVGDLFRHLGELQTAMPYTRIVVCMRHVDGHIALDCLDAGIAGCIAEGMPFDTLATMLPIVVEDHKVFPSFVLKMFAAAALDGRPAGRSDDQAKDGEEAEADEAMLRIPEITPAERPVLAGLARGEANKEIADGLGLTDATVKVHVRNIMRKLKLNSRTKIALWAVRHGFG